MTNTLREAPEKPFSPRIALDSSRSLSSSNNTKRIKIRFQDSQNYNEATSANYPSTNHKKTNITSSLASLNKVLNQSHTTAFLKEKESSFASKNKDLHSETMMEHKVWVAQNLSNPLDEEPHFFFGQSSNRAPNPKGNKVEFFAKGNLEADDVKQLDSWKLEMKKKKLLLSPDIQYKEVPKQPIVPKESSNLKFPEINTHVINKILKDEEEDEIVKKDINLKTLDMKTLVDEPQDQKFTPFRDDKSSFKSLDVKIYENKEEIANTLVMRKVKQYLKEQNLESLNSETLKNHVAMIARNACKHFKSLDGIIAKATITNSVRYAAEYQKFGQTEEKIFNHSVIIDPNPNNNSEKEIVYNYKEIEIELQKSLAKAIEMGNVYTWRRSHLLNEAKNLGSKIKQLEDDLHQIIDKGKELDTWSAMSSPSSRKVKTPNNDTKNDYIIRMKAELREQRLEIQKELDEVKKKHFAKENDILNLERNLKEAKEDKAKYKLQLRDLYLKILKDEVNILKSTNASNYAWVIQALWSTNQKVEERYFPEFLDTDAINYIMECARIQDKLLKFCNENNLLNGIYETDGLKLGSPRDMGLLIKNIKSPTKFSPRNNQFEEKSPEIILSNVRKQIKLLKRENLRVKDLQINSSQSGFRSPKAASRIRYIEPFQVNGGPSFYKPGYDDDIKMTSSMSNTTSRVLRLEIPGVNEDGEERQIVKKIINDLENMKIAEKDKLLKKYITKNFNDSQKDAVLKTYIFLFGSEEGREFFADLRNHQKAYQQKQRYINMSNSPAARNTKSSKSPLHRLRSIKVDGQNQNTYNNSISFQNNKSKEFAEIISIFPKMQADSSPLKSTLSATRNHTIE